MEQRKSESECSFDAVSLMEFINPMVPTNALYKFIIYMLFFVAGILSTILALCFHCEKS